MMRRIGLIAARDFSVTIRSRGFLVGLLVMPVLALILLVLVPRILGSRSPQVRGEVEVIDPTGQVLQALRLNLDPSRIAQRRNRDRPASAAAPAARSAGAKGPPIPRLSLLDLPADSDIGAGKSWLIGTGADQPTTPRHLALVVIHPDAVTRRSGAADYGTYDLYTSARMDDDTEATLREALRVALVASRLQHSGLDPALVETASRVLPPDSVVVAATGEHAGSRGIASFLPFACGILIFFGVMTGGQILMTSTVEEKSSRVIEVLLAAASPLELMWGKLIGQLGVGLLMTAVYVGMALYALAQFSLSGLLDPTLLVYFFAFYVITYLVFGSLMLTVGAAINQMADAQSLMGPVMILLLAGYALTPMIGRAPNSSFSVAVSFIPPLNNFAMLARVASSAPPPAWQVWLTLGIGVVSAAVAVWFAAKIFKIGLLLHGKPPTFATLIKWARQA